MSAATPNTSLILSANPDQKVTPSNPLYAFYVLLGFMFGEILHQLDRAVREADRQYKRAELKQAYEQRRSWRKSDIPRLQTLELNQQARLRLSRLTGRGRPVVRPHLPLSKFLVGGLVTYLIAYGPNSARSERLPALKQTKFWPHYVEALYRGEHAQAKARNVGSPSSVAEETVGRAVHMSASAVHAMCGKIRALRKDDPESANFPQMTLVEFEVWMNTGKHPWYRDLDDSQPHRRQLTAQTTHH